MKKNKLTGALALTLALSCVVGSLAIFTDRVDNDDVPFDYSLEDQGIDVRPVDPDQPDPDPDDPAPDDPGKDLEDIWDMNNEGSIEDKDVYPGEKIDLSFDLYNASDSAVDVRETIVLTVLDHEGQNTLTLKDVLGESEYEVWASSKVDDTDGYNDGVTSLESRIDPARANGILRSGTNTVAYYLAPFTIDGQNEDADNNNAMNVRSKLSYELIMDWLAKNEYQASTCQIDYIVEAKQHADGGADKGWTEVANQTLTIGGNKYEQPKYVPTLEEAEAAVTP